MSDVVITDNTEQSRFEAHLDGELAGFAEYHLRGSSIVFTHTEVLPAFEGKGVGGALVRESLDRVRADGSHDVVPVCPFYRGWLDKHPDYADLIHQD